MRSASGLIYRDGDFIEGCVSLRNGKFTFGTSLNPDADVEGIILPKTVNCHTHLGDAFIKRPDRGTIEELVAPPDGLKHRLLRKVSPEEQVTAMREAITAMQCASHFIDFREGGLEGARRLLIASLGSGLVPVILGRPETTDSNELSALLSVADGIGMSAISDRDYSELASISEHARSFEKIFAMHASEAKREDMGRILELEPDFLVHMVHATDEDLSICADAGIPIVICPSSNRFFGLKPPLLEMLEAGVTVCLGTDNAMLAKPDLLAELRVLRAIFPEETLDNRTLFEIAFMNGGKVLNSLPGLGAANGEHTEFFVLEVPADDPFGAVLNSSQDDVRLFEPQR